MRFFAFDSHKELEDCEQRTRRHVDKQDQDCYIQYVDVVLFLGR